MVLAWPTEPAYAVAVGDWISCEMNGVAVEARCVMIGFMSQQIDIAARAAE